MLFPRGLRAILRRDRVVLVRLPASAALAGFTDRLALTLTQDKATLLLDEDDLPPALPDGAEQMTGLSLITALGVGMSGGEDLGRRILADLARAGIAVSTVSVCDLGLAIAVKASDAEAAMDRITASVPLSR